MSDYMTPQQLRNLGTGKYRDGFAPNYTATGARYRVLCSDGRVRMATITRDADTFWTIPARVQVNGRTVSGYVYLDQWPNGYDSPTYASDPPVWKFSAYAYRRNHDALPQWPTIGASDGRLRTVPQWVDAIIDEATR